MSIIHDALKRAQAKMQEDNKAAPSPPPTTSAPSTPSPQTTLELKQPQPRVILEPVAESRPEPSVAPVKTTPAPKVKVSVPRSKTLAAKPTPTISKKDLQMWIISGLVFTLVLICFGLTFTLIASNRRDQTSRPKISPEEKNQQANQQALQNLASAKKKAAVTKTPSGESLVLNGIMSSEGEQMALINNEIVRPGDYIGEARILKILENQVEIFSKGEVLILKATKL